MELPKFVVLKSNYNNKYLRYIHEDVQEQGFLQFSGVEILSPEVKFEVVKSSCGHGLVHLKSCYNNKYWVRWSPNHWWIRAAADQPEEDQSKWSCTLFKLDFLNDKDPSTIRLLHVQLGHYGCLWRIYEPFGSSLFAGSKSPDKDSCDVCTVIDWEKISPKSPALPRDLALKSSSGKEYLRFVNDDKALHGFVKFHATEATNPYIKFVVENAVVGNGLVHIRCGYNNKYLARCSQNQWWITAEADEPEEDQSKWSCTLFRPVFYDADAKLVRFVHVQLGHYVFPAADAASPPLLDSCLLAGGTAPPTDAFRVVNFESLFTVPRHVTLKGSNAKYLTVRRIGGQQHLEFSGSGGSTVEAENEIHTTGDGSVRILSNKVGKYWKRSHDWDWIVAEANAEPKDDPDTLFELIKLDNDVFALRNLGNKKYCKRLTDKGKINCLSASAPSISDPEVRLKLEEIQHFTSREIKNVSYRVLDARLYSLHDIAITSKSVTNKTGVPFDTEVKLSYTDITSSTWNSSVSSKQGSQTTLKASIPDIRDDGVLKTTGAEFDGAYKWGEKEQPNATVEKAYRVIVPPMSEVTLNLLATIVSYDIPFSYTEVDTLPDGQKITTEMEDGIYTANTFYNFKYQTAKKPVQ